MPWNLKSLQSVRREGDHASVSRTNLHLDEKPYIQQSGGVWTNNEVEELIHSEVYYTPSLDIGPRSQTIRSTA